MLRDPEGSLSISRTNLHAAELADNEVIAGSRFKIGIFFSIISRELSLPAHGAVMLE